MNHEIPRRIIDGNIPQFKTTLASRFREISKEKLRCQLNSLKAKVETEGKEAARNNDTAIVLCIKGKYPSVIQDFTAWLIAEDFKYNLVENDTEIMISW